MACRALPRLNCFGKWFGFFVHSQIHRKLIHGGRLDWLAFFYPSVCGSRRNTQNIRIGPTRRNPLHAWFAHDSKRWNVKINNHSHSHTYGQFRVFSNLTYCMWLSQGGFWNVMLDIIGLSHRWPKTSSTTWHHAQKSHTWFKSSNREVSSFIKSSRLVSTEYSWVQKELTYTRGGSVTLMSGAMLQKSAP